MTLGNPPPCSGPEQGQLWFNAQRKGLFICDGLSWSALLQSKSKDLYLQSVTGWICNQTECEMK